ncbi:hypothetical protein DWF00_20190 [Bosea caraganae]|uniref:Lipoprotein n=1 Tax=Bosea caraganae TaxID=2763117 RepID=A0A370KZ83_9HYPH|nr:hypothetical protein [Bosea caraganae]RDJ20315.1 hypothetical protein DWE98_25480 [Bosea caraganae]RDJ24011.1 hypothetical protein DWF00_20190 [Bosea caraganae]
MKAASIAGDAVVRIALLATVLLLAACASVSDPTAVASVEGCRIETRLELRHIGPPGKFPPTPVNREVRVCRPTGTGSAEFSVSR